MAAPSGESRAGDSQWINPFPPPDRSSEFIPDSITLAQALQLVASANTSLQAVQYQRLAASELVQQADRRPNPELEFEAGDIGGHLSGFRQSEIGLGLSQEFELWGKRKYRAEAAQRDQEAVDLESRIAVFDIFAEARLRFHQLHHAQFKLELAGKAEKLAAEMAKSTKTLVENGAALPSEYLLAELAREQASLELTNVETEVFDAMKNLASIWQGKNEIFRAHVSNHQVASIPEQSILLGYLSDSREMARIAHEEARLEAQLSLERAVARPGLTLSGGIKHAEETNQNSFVVGIALPLPLFDRNQGTTGSLRAETKSLAMVKNQAFVEAEAELRSMYRQLTQLRRTYDAIDTLLLPKAEETYLALKRAFEFGKIPSSSMMEGQRRLIDLDIEKNNVALAIHQDIINIERLLGITFEDMIAGK